MGYYIIIAREKRADKKNKKKLFALLQNVEDKKI